MDIVIEKAKIENAQDIYKIELELFKEEIGESEITEITYMIEKNNVYIAKHDNKIVGYITGMIIDVDDEYNYTIWQYMTDKSEFELFTIMALGVVEDYRNKKIGTRLLEKFIEDNSNTMDKISLQVNKKNKHAIKLYENFGFKTVLEIPKYYKNDTEDGLLMIKEIRQTQ